MKCHVLAGLSHIYSYLQLFIEWHPGVITHGNKSVFFSRLVIGEAWWEISTEKCVSMVQIQWWLYVDICCKGNSSPWFSLFVIYQANNQTSRYEVWWSQGWCWHWLAGRPWLDYAGLIFWTSKPWILASEASNPSGVLITFVDFEWFWFPEGTCFAHCACHPFSWCVCCNISPGAPRSIFMVLWSWWSREVCPLPWYLLLSGLVAWRWPKGPRLSNPMARVEYF